MANTKRRILDRSGNMFLPMNMEGNNYTDSFWQTPKIIIGGGMVFILLGILLQPLVGDVAFGQIVKLLGLWLFAMFFITRYIIFEEKFNYKMYKQMLKYEIQTPAIFWDIVQIKNTGDGAILTYRDGKTAVLLKVERDTITGKPKEFKEAHFDAIQDFYNRLQDYKFSFVQMNIMEPAGNDPRLSELDKLVTKSDNPNIQKLMQLQVGYTKKITKKTLYESDLFLIYVKDRTRIDTIINDVEDCVIELLSGAYIGYRILDENDILEFTKDQYGVSYFNRTEATLNLFSRTNQNTKQTFKVTKIIDADKREYSIQSEQFNRIHKMCIENEKGNFDIGNLNIKRDIINKDPAYKNQVRFCDLIDDEPKQNIQNQGKKDEEYRFHMRKDIQKREPAKGKAILGTSIENAQLDEADTPNIDRDTLRKPSNSQVVNSILNKEPKNNISNKNKQLGKNKNGLDTQQINNEQPIVEVADEEYGEQLPDSIIDWDTLDSPQDEELNF